MCLFRTFLSYSLTILEREEKAKTEAVKKARAAADKRKKDAQAAAEEESRSKVRYSLTILGMSLIVK